MVNYKRFMYYNCIYDNYYHYYEFNLGPDFNFNFNFDEREKERIKCNMTKVLQIDWRSKYFQIFPTVWYTYMYMICSLSHLKRKADDVDKGTMKFLT